MAGIVDSIVNVNAVLVCAIVSSLVFAEDALFVGFVLPGETAAVLGGVVASRGACPTLADFGSRGPGRDHRRLRRV
ncbi:hypothetical protein [Paenarthrobacter sp. PH39-S1]|uniref:hypothetical protein n=1 Tax=Paenarthrobacter sp. PH39-S1 TaxID=3046204 RepID=UPI0024B8B028|nr:hypothetical protein [Paenarthrobacter sp. PH39-S1]MDJ0355257.1 hypothetical protein [Paenarthrobacter sp. PH39-S1]